MIPDGESIIEVWTGLEDLPTQEKRLKGLQTEACALSNTMGAIEEESNKNYAHRLEMCSKVLERITNGEIGPNLAAEWKTKMITAISMMMLELNKSIERDLNITSPEGLKKAYQGYNRVFKQLKRLEGLYSDQIPLKEAIGRYKSTLDQIKNNYENFIKTGLTSKFQDIQHKVNLIEEYCLKREDLENRLSAYEKDHTFLSISVTKTSPTLASFEKRVADAKKTVSQKQTKITETEEKNSAEVESLRKSVQTASARWEELKSRQTKEQRAWIAGLKAAFAKKATFSRDGVAARYVITLSKKQDEITLFEITAYIQALLSENNKQQTDECHKEFEKAFLSEAPIEAKKDLEVVMHPGKTDVSGQLKNFANLAKRQIDLAKRQIMGEGTSLLDTLASKTSEREKELTASQVQFDKAKSDYRRLAPQSKKTEQVKPAEDKVQSDLKDLEVLEQLLDELKQKLKSLVGEASKEQEDTALTKLKEKYAAQLANLKSELSSVSDSILQLEQ
jgi:hemerythrin-like domain-containing protein